MVPVSDQDMNTHLAEVSRVRISSFCVHLFPKLNIVNKRALLFLSAVLLNAVPLCPEGPYRQTEHTSGPPSAVPVCEQIL